MSASKSNILLLDHLLKCRCCFKWLGRRDKRIKINTTIEKHFFDLTKIELKESTMYSRYFCLECNTKLKDISKFRESSILKQMNLYEFVDEYTTGLNSSGCKVKEEYIDVKESSSFVEEFDHNEYNQFEPEVKIEKEDNQIFLGDSFWTHRESSTELNEFGTAENMLCDLNESYETKTKTEDTLMDKSVKPFKARPVCSTCFLSFNTQSALNYHIKRVHKKVRDYFCDLCDYSSLGKDTLRPHMLTHISFEHRIKYPCHLCSTICISIVGYHNHVKSVHGERKNHDCVECGRKFTSVHGMREHVKSFHQHIRFECPICKKSFSKYSLSKHNRRIHGIITRPKRLSAKPKSDIKSSIRKQQPAICPECGVSYNSQPALTYHLKRVHLKVKDCFCDICGYACLGRDSIRAHMITHINLEDRKKTLCAICKSVFISAIGLQTHMKTIHGEKKLYECRDCGKSLKSLHGFKSHVKNTHQRVENFNCTICNKSYGTERTLKGHIATAHGEKTIACEVCGKMYPTMNRLKNHLIYHEEPKFVCDIVGCGKKFFVQELLIGHKKSHIGQRDFACHLCDKKYFLSSHLSRHILHFHKQLKVACELPGCTSKFARKETYRNHVLSHHKDLSQAAVNALLKKIRELVQA